MAGLLVDTDIFIDHLRGFRKLAAGRDRLHYSVVTRCELLAGKVGSAVVTELLGPHRELDVNRKVAERAGRIRRETGIATPDALIAATAIEHRLRLLTRNLRDFETVRQLRIRQPAGESSRATPGSQSSSSR